MKVLMLVSNPFTHDPRFYKEATSLVKAGHKVTVIAWDTEKKLPGRQNWHGIDVVRVRSTWLMKPLLKDIFRLPLWWREVYRKAVELHQEVGFDLIHCRDLDTLPVAVRLKKKLGLKLIYDSFDNYAYMLAMAFPRFIADLAIPVEKRLLTQVDEIIVTAETHKSYFEGITEKPISIITNCMPLQGQEYEPPDDGGVFTLIYIGSLTRFRSLLELVEVVSQLPDVRCIIGGIGSARYVRTLEECCARAANVDFLGLVPFDEVIPMTKKADTIVLMINPKAPNDSICLTNKQFEAMVCGRPIICTKDTYSGQWTEREEVGLTIKYSKQALKEAIITLRDNPELRERLGRNALNAAITRHNWDIEEKKLLKLYDKLGL